MGKRVQLSLARVLCAAACAAAATGAACAPAARADDWFPHPAGAQWTYNWSDATYNPIGTTETVTVASENAPTGCGWQLAWSGDTEIPLGGTGGPTISSPDNGTVCFSDQSDGLTNTDWSGDPPPINEPPLCQNASQCASNLGSTLFNVIWGSRAPVISEPLLEGTSWTASGGDGGDATSVNQYLGLQQVSVPAFPGGVLAAVVRSTITLSGSTTAGDQFGSGTRLTWWVYGVGPVKVLFSHLDGTATSAQLMSTNMAPLPARADDDYFPLRSGLTSRYRWTNPKHLPRPEVEKVAVTDAVNDSARVLVSSVSGPLRVSGAYDFDLRVDGLSTTYIATSAVSLAARQPKLGRGLHFFTPVDLMTYGFNPVLPAYPVTGTTWKSGDPRDLSVYGVTGTTKVLGLQRVHVPAGTFEALELQSTLTQRGHKYGSGVRTMWFAAGRGLVKLRFKHRDGSVSLVQLLR
jgi:hypothetical protein